MIASNGQNTAPTIGAVLQEAAILARTLEDSPLWRNESVREGIITIQQQADRYATAPDDATRADAALWAREGLQRLSTALSETYDGMAPDENETGWLTANDIGKLFGGHWIWKARVIAELHTTPDASLHDPDPDYLRALLAIAGISQREAAQKIGISERVMRYYVSEQSSDNYRPAPYPVQYAIERLAAG